MEGAGPAAAEEVDREHVERSRQLWDRWSGRYGASERDFAPLLDDAVERLGLEPGDDVLDIGCGPGTNLHRLRELVGPHGRVVAVDVSPKMVERARRRVVDEGWENVEVIRADASRLALDQGRFDGALASLSLSVMPDVEAAARRVDAALAPETRVVVLDLRLVPSGPLRLVNPLLSLFYRWFANWNADDDVLDALGEVFDDVAVEETYAAGACYRAVATKPAEP